jgi:hypothetical protein
MGRNSERVVHLVMTGAAAAAEGRARDVAAVAEALVRCAQQLGLPTFTPTAGSVLSGGLVPVWEDGWQPAELRRYVARRLGARQAELLVAAMGAADAWAAAGGAAAPPAWSAQLAELGVVVGPPSDDWLAVHLGTGGWPLIDAMAVLLETVGMVMSLRTIDALLPPPSEWSHPVPIRDGTTVDDPVLAKIRALLAKAESTGFEAESEALTAKAQELMARHAIDDALARAGRTRRESPVTRRLPVDDPYAAAKSLLLQVVASPNGVRCVWFEDLAMMAVVGFASDVDAVETLFTSLLVQGSRAMLAQGKVTDGRGRSRTRSFRQSFLLAFAGRISERLAQAAAQARREAETELSTSLVPVFADRDREVDEAVTRAFPHLKKTRGPAITNEAGWRAGRTAAEVATLGAHHGMVATG